MEVTLRRSIPIALALIIYLDGMNSIAFAADARATVTKVSADLCDEMIRHKTLSEKGPVSCSRLALIKFGYFGFDNTAHSDGEIIVLDAAARNVAAIFDTLLDRRFPIAKAHLMNHYDGDDDAADVDNNTSSFNDRVVAGTRTLSLHAYGLAIDLNPVQNPFIQIATGKREVSPDEGKQYLDRKAPKPGMAETAVDIFADNGFSIWGGDWHNPIDYQHFQVSRALAQKLAQAPAANARAIFEQHVERYRQCRRSGKSRGDCAVN